jgi:non-ribosomal peptide synthetase component F
VSSDAASGQLPDRDLKRAFDAKKIETQFGRLYRTGDLARGLADGVIEYLGRVKHEVDLSVG